MALKYDDIVALEEWKWLSSNPKVKSIKYDDVVAAWEKWVSYSDVWKKKETPKVAVWDIKEISLSDKELALWLKWLVESWQLKGSMTLTNLLKWDITPQTIAYIKNLRTQSWFKWIINKIWEKNIKGTSTVVEKKINETQWDNYVDNVIKWQIKQEVNIKNYEEEWKKDIQNVYWSSLLSNILTQKKWQEDRDYTTQGNMRALQQNVLKTNQDLEYLKKVYPEQWRMNQEWFADELQKIQAQYWQYWVTPMKSLIEQSKKLERQNYMTWQKFVQDTLESEQAVRNAQYNYDTYKDYTSKVNPIMAEQENIARRVWDIADKWNYRTNMWAMVWSVEKAKANTRWVVQVVSWAVNEANADATKANGWIWQMTNSQYEDYLKTKKTQ